MTSRLYRRADFYTQYADRALPGQRLTQADMDIVIKFLERDRRILSTRQEVIKLHASPLQGKEQQGVSDMDVNVLDIKSTESALLDQIADLEKRIAECVVFVDDSTALIWWVVQPTTDCRHVCAQKSEGLGIVAPTEQESATRRPLEAHCSSGEHPICLDEDGQRR